MWEALSLFSLRSRFINILFKIQKANPLKQFVYNYLDRGSVHASKIGWAHGKIQHKIHLKRDAFCNFSSVPKRKCMKRIWNVYQYINSFSKTKFSWPQGAKCTWKFSKNSSALVKFKNRPRAPTWRKQVWIPRRTISLWKASLPPQKENWAFFELPLYIFCLLTVYLNLKCGTLVLKPPHGDRAAAILLKMDILHEGFQIW